MKSGDDDWIYDVDVAIKSILEFMKHKIRDAQQKKAKVDAFDVIDHVIAFWLKDFAQKILSIKYREGQKEYFGKKGMSMHVDVFISKKKDEDEFRKHVYLTVIYRCD